VRKSRKENGRRLCNDPKEDVKFECGEERMNGYGKLVVARVPATLFHDFKIQKYHELASFCQGNGQQHHHQCLLLPYQYVFNF